MGLCSYLLIGFWYDDQANARRRQEGVHRQPHRRLRLPARHVPAVQHASARSTFARDRARTARRSLPAAALGDRADRPAALRRRHRQVGADPALRLAARRHGRPDAGVRADPRRDDGDGGRLHGRRGINVALRRSRRRRSPWWPSIGALTAFFAATIALAQTDIKKVLAYSTVSPARLHVPRRGRRRVRGGHLPPHHARLLQGAALPRRRVSVIHAHTARSEQDMRKMGGLATQMPVTFVDVPDRDARHRRHPAVRRLLPQGRDPVARVRAARASRLATLLWALGRSLTALLTAFYMFRGSSADVLRRAPRRRRRGTEHASHESPLDHDAARWSVLGRAHRRSAASARPAALLLGGRAAGSSTARAGLMPAHDGAARRCPRRRHRGSR